MPICLLYRRRLHQGGELLEQFFSVITQKVAQTYYATPPQIDSDDMGMKRQQYFCFRIHTIPIQIHFLFIRIQVLKYISSIVVDKKFLFFCVKNQVTIFVLYYL